MGLFDKWFNTLRDIRGALALIARLSDSASDQAQGVAVMRSYRQGHQREGLRVKPDQHNDNIVLNLIGLVLNRTVSQMMGGGFTLDFEGEGETEQEQYITALLDANKQEILFHRAALAAGEAGTGYLLLNAGTVEYQGKEYPRIQLIDPAFVMMDTAPEDFELVIRYTIKYNFVDADGKEKTRRRVVEHDGEASWTIRDYITDNYGKEQLVSETPWLYPFAPVLHWQNKPTIDEPYGEPDIDPAGLALQDRLNFTASNISKIIRLYAHPQRFVRTSGIEAKIEVGPDQYPKFPADANSGIYQLEPQGDMAAALNHYADLRRTFFDTARVVDIDSLADKLGQMTNFGLYVLYQDNINLIATKRELFGDMLAELVRRLLALANMKPLECEVVWPDWLPQNEVEQLTALETQQRLGVISKETIADKLGLDWEQEAERIKADQEAEQARQENVGSMLLQGFNRGGGGLNIPLRARGNGQQQGQVE